ncbi:restriction endonuclease subunit S [Aeromonas veronii]|uniref:restriction endonuclease subunit S n=1 Tax=Aeromonas veronii TaxID=654 RepID=UPI001431B021|nr:restriction endonuclease subunit S [Aeromonas veronii]NJI18727.1 restriction endonuclease subunit S [Aeromonas veronii]
MAEQMIQHKEGEKVAMQAIPTGYKQTEVGVIPEDWSVESLSQVAQITRGKFSARPRNDPKFFGGDIPFIQTGDITRSNGYDVNFSQTINELGLSVSKLFPAGSLFFTIAANIGDVAIAKYPAACPDSLVVIKENGHINKRWLYHILSSKKEVFESMATSNAQLNINLEKLNPYVLGVPALEEQTAIANVLSDTDALIAGLEQLIAKKQAIKTATMQQLLTGRTRLPPFSKRSDGTPKGYKQSELGQIPEDWETSLLGGGADKIMVGIASAATHAYCKSGILMLRNQNIKPNRLDSNDLLFINKEYEMAFKNKRLKAGGLLTARTGYPGTTCIIPDDFENAQSFTALITRPTNKVNSKFLAIFMNSEIGVDFFDKNQIGGGQKNINASTLRTFIVAAPKLEEQTAIATIISDMDMEIVALEEKLAKTRDLKQGMMQQLLTGRIRLPLEVGV